MDKKEELKAVIKDYESGKENEQLTLEKIKQLTGKDVAGAEIRGYSSYTCLDDFCINLLTEPIADWAGIDDERALLLLREILANVTKDNIVHRNSEALEKRYRKKTGFISDLIFWEDVTDEQALLALLKKDTTIYL
jgi:hypothetical protein